MYLYDVCSNSRRAWLSFIFLTNCDMNWWKSWCNALLFYRTDIGLSPVLFNLCDHAGQNYLDKGPSNLCSSFGVFLFDMRDDKPGDHNIITLMTCQPNSIDMIFKISLGCSVVAPIRGCTWTWLPTVAMSSSQRPTTSSSSSRVVLTSWLGKSSQVPLGKSLWKVFRYISTSFSLVIW